jgi:hypothetical protein|tara:strand:+ start:124 stop:276 length:153 start_codon:yes stop_codon:yes gene_type:complete
MVEQVILTVDQVVLVEVALVLVVLLNLFGLVVLVTYLLFLQLKEELVEIE